MAKRSNGRGYLTYKAYVFRTKDPVIDELRTFAQDRYGKLNYTTLRKIHNNGDGPSVTCMANWFFGSTRMPKSATIEAAGRSIGKKRVWVNL